MLRFAGILTGSALAIALIVVTIGTPRIAAPVKAPRVSQAEPTAQAARELRVPEPAAEETGIIATGTATKSVDGEDAEPAPAPQQVVPESPVASESTDALRQPERNSPQVPASNWYAFWSPFRSEIAADGFVARLQQTTGLDYRVVKLEPGVYEVAFAYFDDTDRAEKLQRISSATGLDLSGG